MVYVQVELLFQRRRIVRNIGVPGLEVGLGQLENPEATVLLAGAFQIEFAFVLVVELLNDSADTLLVDFGDGRKILRALW